MTEKITKAYKGEWIINTQATPTEFKNIVTPSFKPLPDTSINFCFEAFYQEVKSASLFKLKLVKLSGACNFPTLQVIVKAKVLYSDRTVFKDYGAKPSQQINTMTKISFEDDIRDCKNHYGDRTAHGSRMARNKLIIECEMTFNYYSQLACKSGVKTKSCNKHVDLIKNLIKMYEPSTMCDFSFKVGGKTFQAHKFVLAAHSPVFKNMMTHEFQETETNCANITDFAPEIFDLFLRSLYTGDIEDKSLVSVKELYLLADKYDVGFLKTECSETLISHLSENTVCEILQLAYKFCDPGLKTAAVSYAVENITEIVDTECWEDIVETNPIIAYDVVANFIPE